MNYENALWAILVKQNYFKNGQTPLQKSRILLRHKTYFTDDLFNMYMAIVNQ